MHHSRFLPNVKIIVVLLVLSLLLYGDWDYKIHNGNNIECWVSNFGEIAQDSTNYPGCEWPKESGHKYIFGGGLWFGMKQELKPNFWQHFVSMGYNPRVGRGECVPGLVRQGTTAYYNPYVRVYMYPEDWPPDPDTFPMAPQISLTFEDSWSCFNDCDSNCHFPGSPFEGGKPIGIEVYQSGYADPRCPDVIFYRYTIKNCTTHTILNSIVGICIDYDIGEGSDDCYGLIYDRWFYEGADSFYIYCLPFGYDFDWQEPGWDTVGVIGFLLVEPVGNQRSLTCVSFNRPIDPIPDYYAYSLLDTGIIPEWPPEPNDKNIILASGPFALSPGESKNFGVAIILALATLEDTMPLAIVAKMAREFYWENITVEEESVNRMDSKVIATITKGMIKIGNCRKISIYDPSGRMIYEIKNPPPVINLRNFKAGIYFLIVKDGDRTRTEKIIMLK